jgi:protein-L-isoaspartate(D-aspartate) O-methyltransferase
MGRAVPNDPGAADRRRMVADIQVHARALRSVTGRPQIAQAVLDAMQRVSRDRFVPQNIVPFAYQDRALTIGHGQTISQPFIVALMTELAAVGPHDVVLEIGTGSGYQTAILAELAQTVYSIELIPELADQARHRLDAAGYTNVHTCTGDGYAGWGKDAPYDAIVVTAAVPDIPPALIEQLARGGRLVIPIGREHASQNLVLVNRDDAGRLDQRDVLAVTFVPLVRAD